MIEAAVVGVVDKVTPVRGKIYYMSNRDSERPTLWELVIEAVHRKRLGLRDGWRPQAPCSEADDDACVAKEGDYLPVHTITLNIRDKETKATEFLPANVFTPNLDGVNDFYSLDDLPIDNCAGRFLGFRVHNRWGNEVFITVDREFQWAADGLEAGVYFYVVEFSNVEYNGSLSILY